MVGATEAMMVIAVIEATVPEPNASEDCGYEECQEESDKRGR